MHAFSNSAQNLDIPFLDAIDGDSLLDEKPYKFFDSLYEALISGKIAPDDVKGQIPCHITTYIDGPDNIISWVSQDYRNPDTAPLKCLQDSLDAQKPLLLEKINAMSKDHRRSWGDYSATLDYHFAKRGEFEKVFKIMDLLQIPPHPELLHQALSHDETEIAEKLVKTYKMDPNARNQHGARPPISYAESIEAFDKMIELGADPTIIDGFGDDVTYLYCPRSDLKFEILEEEIGQDAAQARKDLKQYGMGFILACYRNHQRDPFGEEKSQGTEQAKKLLQTLPSAIPQIIDDKSLVMIDKNNSNFFDGYTKGLLIKKLGLLPNLSYGEQKYASVINPDALAEMLGTDKPENEGA